MNGARLSELECRLAAEMSLAPLAGAQREHAKWRVSLLFIARPLRTSGKKAPPGLAFDGGLCVVFIRHACVKVRAVFMGASNDNSLRVLQSGPETHR